MTRKTYLRIVLGSAIYDLLFTLPFATPWGFVAIANLLRMLDEALGLPGTITEPDALHILLANLMGSAVLVWAILRLHLRLPVFGRYDAAIRLLFALWLVVAMSHGVSLVLGALLALEVVLVTLQLWPWRKDESRDPGASAA